MKRVPKKLLDAVKSAAPVEAQVIPLPWLYEEEDYNIAVVVPDAIADLQGHDVESHVLDAVTMYDETNGTFTVCMIWPEREKERAGLS